MSLTYQPRPRFHRRARAQQPTAQPQPEDDVLTGTLLAYAGATVPAGYLECDGSAVSRATYAALFAALGTAYGPGDGATTFNLPDLRGRALIGAGTGAGLTPRARGNSGGAERVTLAVGEMPRHSHQYGNVTGLDTESGEANSGSGAYFLTSAALSTDAVQTDPNGNDQSHENMIPFGVARWIVKS